MSKVEGRSPIDLIFSVVCIALALICNTFWVGMTFSVPVTVSVVQLEANYID